MHLPGKLARTTLGDLLGRLHRAGATGTLELVAEGRRHRLDVERGAVAAVELAIAEPPSRLGEVLVGEGMAKLRDVAAALSEQSRLGGVAPPHGELLVRAGVLSAAVRDAALRRQTQLRLDRLFHLLQGQDAEIRFHVGIAAGSRRHRPVVAPLEPLQFLHGRPRARDGRWTSTPPPPRTAELPRERALRLLGLDRGADERAIRRAFRVAAARVHPDRHPTLPPRERARLQTALAELSAAYHLLVA